MEATVKVITDGCVQGWKRDEDGFFFFFKENLLLEKNLKIEIPRQYTRREKVKRKTQKILIKNKVYIEKMRWNERKMIIEPPCLQTY